MNFFQKLFHRKTTEEVLNDNWDEIQNEKESLNLKDAGVRERFVLNCLEEMQEASAELDRVNAEYSLVTSYLTDMEEIDALPKEERKTLEQIARHLHDLRKEHDTYVLSESLMTEAEYNRMELLCEEVPEGYKRLRDEEDYRSKVKQDLGRIGKERSAYDYRRNEVKGNILNARGIATIVMVAGVVLILILLALQLALKLDVTIGYYITVAALAISLTIIYVRYTDEVREKKRIDNTINELILLENKVKIRYVNNKNLLDYLYTKFDVKSAAELNDLYTRYTREKEERRKFERNEAIYEDELSRLVKLLKSYQIKDPEIWIHQSDALYDNREMVEIRHSYIGRRQKLRKRMEYNQQIAFEASDEIKGIIADYPESADSVINLVNSFEENK